MKQCRGIIFLHEGQQEALVGLFGPRLWHFDTASHLATGGVLATAVQWEQSHERRHLQHEVQEDRQCGVQGKRPHRRHRAQSTCTNTDQPTSVYFFKMIQDTHGKFFLQKWNLHFCLIINFVMDIILYIWSIMSVICKLHNKQWTSLIYYSLLQVFLITVRKMLYKGE